MGSSIKLQLFPHGQPWILLVKDKLFNYMQMPTFLVKIFATLTLSHVSNHSLIFINLSLQWIFLQKFSFILIFVPNYSTENMMSCDLLISLWWFLQFCPSGVVQQIKIVPWKLRRKCLTSNRRRSTRVSELSWRRYRRRRAGTWEESPPKQSPQTNAAYRRSNNRRWTAYTSCRNPPWTSAIDPAEGWPGSRGAAARWPRWRRRRTALRRLIFPPLPSLSLNLFNFSFFWVVSLFLILEWRFILGFEGDSCWPSKLHLHDFAFWPFYFVVIMLLIAYYFFVKLLNVDCSLIFY